MNKTEIETIRADVEALEAAYRFTPPAIADLSVGFAVDGQKRTISLSRTRALLDALDGATARNAALEGALRDLQAYVYTLWPGEPKHYGTDVMYFIKDRIDRALEEKPHERD